ncbi:hypothetical protein TSUD_323730 [Trifolium subterraneum]|uniref:Uncharacterized protein n=1 Tax=Trifolium subterraneum TaxID=3900 RepID=A0A2Z6NU55_TRISU|nr:hypothetical protein TSUD_323730 [Trifolium subterraneum]
MSICDEYDFGISILYKEGGIVRRSVPQKGWVSTPSIRLKDPRRDKVDLFLNAHPVPPLLCAPRDSSPVAT